MAKRQKDRQYNDQKKDRQYNGQKKDRQYNGQKTEGQSINSSSPESVHVLLVTSLRTPTKLIFSGISSCSTSYIITNPH